MMATFCINKGSNTNDLQLEKVKLAAFKSKGKMLSNASKYKNKNCFYKTYKIQQGITSKTAILNCYAFIKIINAYI